MLCFYDRSQLTITQDPFNTDEMAKEFSMQFCKQAFTVGMQCVFNFQDKKLMQIVVKVGKKHVESE